MVWILFVGLPSATIWPLPSRGDHFAERAKHDIDLPDLKRRPEALSAPFASTHSSIKHGKANDPHAFQTCKVEILKLLVAETFCPKPHVPHNLKPKSSNHKLLKS